MYIIERLLKMKWFFHYETDKLQLTSWLVSSLTLRSTA